MAPSQSHEAGPPHLLPVETNEIFRALGRIEAKVQSVEQLVTELKNDSATKLTDHETRLRSLEVFHQRALALLAAFSLVWPLIVKRFF